MTTYLSRSAWTSASTGGSTLTGSQLVGVAVHWPGTTQAAIGAQSQLATAARIRGYRDFHVNSRGWSDVGYNFAIDQAGRVWMLRSTSWAGNRVGAHCASPSNPTANHKYVGVLLILGQSEQPSTAMVEAFGDWYHTRFLPVWKGRTQIRGHTQVPGASTACPGARVLDLVKSGSLAQPPEEDDMPTAQENAVAAWGTDNLVPAPAGSSTKKTNPSWRPSYTLSRIAQETLYTIPAELRAAKIRDAAILDAVSGLDTAAILAHIDGRAAEAATRDAALVELLAQHASGELDAQAVVDELGRRLSEPGDEPA